jgi:hypothetical protein
MIEERKRLRKKVLSIIEERKHLRKSLVDDGGKKTFTQKSCR